jgi:hypothetical protein
MKPWGMLTLVVGLALSLLACAGDTPTGPGAPLDLQVSLHSATAPSILRASLSFDGTLVSTSQAASPSGALNLSGTVRGARPGRHTLTVTLLAQTPPPNDTVYEYSTSGSVFSGSRQIMVQEKRGRLATGESLTIPFDL